MASSNTDSTNQVRVVLAPRDHTILGHLLLQPVFALTVFGGALGLKRKLDSAESPQYLYPRRGGSGSSGGHSGGSRSSDSGEVASLEVVYVFPLAISASFLLYNLVMIYTYLKNKMNLREAIQWNVLFWVIVLLSTVITGRWASEYASFGSPPLAATFLGAIFLE